MNLEMPSSSAEQPRKRGKKKSLTPSFDLSDTDPGAPAEAAPAAAPAKKKPSDLSGLRAKLADIKKSREGSKETHEALRQLREMAPEEYKAASKDMLSQAEAEEVAADLKAIAKRSKPLPKAEIVEDAEEEVEDDQIIELTEMKRPDDEKHRATAIVDRKKLEKKEKDELAALRAEFKGERKQIAKELEAPEKPAMSRKEKKELLKDVKKAPKAAKPFEELSAKERMKLSPDELLAMAQEAQPEEKPEEAFARGMLSKMRETADAIAADRLEKKWMAEGDEMSARHEQEAAALEERYGGKVPASEVVMSGRNEQYLDWVAELDAGIDMDQYARLVRRQANLDDMVSNKLGTWWQRQKAKFELWAISRELESFEKQIDSELSARNAERKGRGEAPLTASDIRRMVRREYARQGKGGMGGKGFPGNPTM